ncbi:hypothetical protein PLESTB_000112500 [Pleodorina starrii]|uniref:Trafficking protein particle complex subunit 11 domain-containing protein n=1 Tax=Pleodorina starrii TaxID=330485 RepID=A0A9W6BAK4_9CHLO|nr:hypothetical protein PLESTB_000112500 [Pleodorina starrii]
MAPMSLWSNLSPGHLKRMALTAGPLAGILKSDWFAKHRGKKPAMAVALVERRELEGDPTTWNRMMYGLKLIADAAGQRGAGVLVAVVQPQGLGDLPPDRVQAVSHNLTVDRRLIIPLPILAPPGALPDDPAIRHVRDAALARLGKLVLELCTAYYSRLSKHVADKAAARRSTLGGPLPPELAARTAFKLAVYAEFRQDWATAVAHYRESYAAILNVQIGLPPRPELWTQVCAVAELVHLKLIMLAVHQGRVEDAVAQVRAHLAHFNRPPGVLPPAAQSSHLGYLVRQHQVAAQEVGTHVDALPAYMPSPANATGATTMTGAGAGFTGGGAAAGATGLQQQQLLPQQQQQLTGGGAAVAAGATGATINSTGAIAAAAASSTLKDCSRAHLLMAAARMAVARRQAADAMRAARAGGGGGSGGGAPLLDTAPVRRGQYVGQLVLRNEAAQSEECRLVTAAYVIDVMNSALLILKDCAGVDRLRSQLGGMMASEHILANNLSAARKLLLQVCHQYRREGWLLPLLQALVSLREVAQRLRLPAEHLCYSLEIAALATQLQVQQPQHPHAAALSSPTQRLQRHPSLAAAANGGGGGSSGGAPPSQLPHARSTPSLAEERRGAAAAAALSAAVASQASCAARVVDPAAAMAACRSAVNTLVTGISEIKQGIMKTPATVPPTPSSAEPHAADGGAPPTPSGPSTPSSVSSGGGSSGGLPRHFHYTVEYLDLREAQRRAREAGDPRPVADIMHRHTQQDFGWCRCLALAAGFTYGRPDPDTVDFYLALYNQMPLPMPLKAVVLHFADDHGDMWVQALPGILPADEAPTAPLPQHIGSALDSATHSFHHLHLNSHLRPHTARQQQRQQGGQNDGEQFGSPTPAEWRRSHNGQAAATPAGFLGRASDSGAARLPGQLHHTDGPPSTSDASTAAAPPLPPYRWAHYSVRLAPRCLGRLRAERAILLLSDHATVVFKLASFPPATAAAAQPGVLTGPLLVPPRVSDGANAAGAGAGGASVDHAASPFRSVRAAATAGPAVSPGQLVLNVAHLGPLPTLSYGLPAGLALLGEHAPLLAVLAVPPGGRPLVGASMEFVIGRTSGGLQPSDIVLVVDDTVATRGLMALNNERYRIPLPPVAPGASHTVRLWARSAAAGTAAVAAVLLCPAQVTATATLTFEEPFEFKCRMSSEVGVHTLSLPRLSSRELGSTALTIGQPVMVTAMIRALQPATLELAGAQVALEPGAAIKLVADPNQQIAAHGGPGGGSGGTAAMRLSRGDVFTLLLPICPTELLEHSRSMGRLNLRWRRCAGSALTPAMPPSQAQAQQNSHGHHGNGSHPHQHQHRSDHQHAQDVAAGRKSAEPPATGGRGAGTEGGGEGEGEAADPLAKPCPDPWVTSVLELPRVTVSESLLTARTLGPAQITTGIAFTYTLQLQNFSSTPLELMISLMDAPGFACSNERSPSLSVPPRERASVAWTLTASLPGHQQLPGVRLLAPRHNCALTTQSPHVYVQPF